MAVFIKFEENDVAYGVLSLVQWFLTFLRSGNTFDHMKNLRNIEINDPKNKQKHPA